LVSADESAMILYFEALTAFLELFREQFEDVEDCKRIMQV
jgi:hypothetical protein